MRGARNVFQTFFICKLSFSHTPAALHFSHFFAFLFIGSMPRNNESFDKYLFEKAQSGAFDNPIKSKRIRTKTNFYIDEESLKVSDKPKKRKKMKVTVKHDLDDDSDEELDRLRSKYCTGSKKIGNKKISAIEDDEIKKSRFFIDEENSDSDDEKEYMGSTCLERAEMKATDDALINGKEIQLRVSDCQRLLDEKRRSEKRQKCHNALINLKRDKDIRSSRSISNSNNSTMNSNNITSTSHDSSTTTTSSIVNNSNNSTNTTTTSSNNSGDSNCNNIHNININIHDAAGLNSRQDFTLRQFNDIFASQRFMAMNDFYRHSLGTYQSHHHYGQLQGHQSLAMYHGLADSSFYNPAVNNSIMSSTTAGMFTSGTNHVPNEYLDLLFRNYSLRCTGIRDTNWLIMFKQALSIYLSGGSLRRGYNSQFDHVSEWYAKQRNMKPQLEREKQDLLGVIGI